MKLTYDQREAIICDMQNVRVTDWAMHPTEPEVVHEIRECTAADLLDCVLKGLEEFAPPEAVPAEVMDAVQSAWASAKNGELEGWEVALIERRMKEQATTPTHAAGGSTK